MLLVYSGINYHFSQFLNNKKARFGTDQFWFLPKGRETKPQNTKLGEKANISVRAVGPNKRGRNPIGEQDPSPSRPEQGARSLFFFAEKPVRGWVHKQVK